MINKEQVIAIYGSHDASVTFIDKKGELRVYEYERYVEKRYAMYSHRFDNRSDMGSCEKDRRGFLDLIKSNLKNENIRLILHLEIDNKDAELLKEYFPYADFQLVGHHYAHACSGFFSSNFKEALIISVDGGGWDEGGVSTTNVYIGQDDTITQLPSSGIDFGNPYSGIGYLISEVSPSPEGPESIHALSYAGKIMGLCAYGLMRYDWIEPLKEYYKTNDLKKLCQDINLPYGYNTIKEEDSYDLAYTSQHVFEDLMWEFIEPYITKYNTNVVLVGGCALNVLFNQTLKEILDTRHLQLYVPPNPNDCGLSYGMFLSKFHDMGKNEICYSGIEILDKNRQQELIKNYNAVEYDYSDIVKLLKEGKILGCIRDNSEVGPRALGNRSIICDPSFDNMKDILNAKVKFREWFRPFAPVCRFKDSNKYFRYVYESKYMSYAPLVRPEYTRELKAITHIDSTARLQTVTPKDHLFFDSILEELDKQGYIPVILNTSFNIRGKPILTKIEDALYVLDHTELDFVVTDKYIISKK